MINKKVTIILATYNGELYLREQLDSIVNQSFLDYQLLIGDDCSTDNTVKIIEEYQLKYQNIHLLCNIKRLGHVLNFENLVLAKKSKKVKKSLQKRKPKAKPQEYHVVVKHAAINGARAYFLDNRLSPNYESRVDRVNLNAYNIDSKEKSWLKYRVSARVNGKGYLKSKGSLRHTPLRQVGTAELDKISLKELNPYIQESAYLRIDDGYLSAKTKTEYALSPTKPDLSVTGSVKLEEFFTSDYRDNSSVLSIVTLGMRSFTYEMSPNRLFVDELSADSFFINAVVDIY